MDVQTQNAWPRRSKGNSSGTQRSGGGVGTGIGVHDMKAQIGEVSILRQSRRLYDSWPLKGA